MPGLSYHQSMRALLEGTCGANPHLISLDTGLSRVAVRNFLRGSGEARPDTVDRIGMFLWRRLNAGVLLTEADRCRA